MLYWTDRGNLPYGNSLNRCSLSVLDSAVARGGLLQDTILTRPPLGVLERNLYEAIGLRVDVDDKRIFVNDLGGCVYDFGMNDGTKRKLYEDLGPYTGISLINAA